MTYLKPLLSLAIFASLASPALSQDDAEAFSAVCAAQEAHAGHGASETQADTLGMNEHQRASMAGMKRMNRDMAQGMMQEDADAAFVCGMIAHHEGAIDMAEVELQHGDEPWAKAMAQKIFDAQKQEIADLKGWLEKNAN